MNTNTSQADKGLTLTAEGRSTANCGILINETNRNEGHFNDVTKSSSAGLNNYNNVNQDQIVKQSTPHQHHDDGGGTNNYHASPRAAKGDDELNVNYADGLPLLSTNVVMQQPNTNNTTAQPPLPV